jgi:hypothetical protein
MFSKTTDKGWARGNSLGQIRDEIRKQALA